MPSESRSRRVRWALFWTTSFFLLQSSLIPGERIPRFLENLNDKFLHSLEYFILFWAAAGAFSRAKTSWLKTHVTSLGLAWCLVLGIITEVLQSYVPNRHASSWDAAADFAGALLAALWLGWRSARLPLFKP